MVNRREADRTDPPIPSSGHAAPDGAGFSRLEELAGEYEVTRELGRGGTAVVYHARERDLGREVAIKVVHQTHVDDAEAVARLAREARLVAQLRHPNIVTLFGTRHLSDGSLALIMQYVPGRTLKEAVRNDGPLPVSTATSVLREIALALHHAHQRQGLVHRDVKPENIYLDTEGGRSLLSDFGIARSSEVESSLTLVGTALGTPAYMSPEQIDGLPLDGRSDLYSLGLVAYEMLTGQQPWAGHNLYTIIYKQKHEQLPAISEIRRDLPPQLQRAIEGLLRKNRDDRWGDAARFAAALSPSASAAGIAPPVITHRLVDLPVRAADPVDDSPTIVYRPQDDPDASPDVPESDPSIAAPSPVPDAESASVTSGSAANDDSEAGASAATAHDSQTEASPATAHEHTPVLRFFLDDEIVEQHEPSAVATTIGARRSRLPLLIAMALILTLAGAIAPLIGADRNAVREDVSGDRGVDGAPASDPAPAPTQTAGAPARLVSMTDDQTGYAGEVLPVPVGLVVRDAEGRAVQGAEVELEVSAGDGEVRPQVAVTDSAGLAMARWTLGEVPGANELQARIRGLPESAVSMRAMGVAGPIDRLLVTAGADQDAPRGTALPEPIVVRAEDARGNPMAGVRVEFMVVDGSGTAQPAFAVTDSTGAASTSWTIGSAGEANTLRARVADSGVQVDVSIRGEYRLSTRTQLAAGGTHSCLLASGGELRCWGANDRGQLGSGGAGRGADVAVVRGPIAFARVATGVSHTCALDRDGRAHCWGANDSGQLGVGDQDDRIVPSPVRTPESFVSIVSGLAHTCAMTSDGRVFCWGDGSSGQTGDGSAAVRTEPVRVAGSLTFTTLAAGWRHTCGLTGQGVTFCWGSNSDGQLGAGTSSHSATPVRVAADVPFTAISTGAAHTCGVTAVGETYCWGQNSSGQLGDATRTDSPRPVHVHTEVPLASTVAGAVHTCGLTTSGAAYCWGRNNLGQLGIGSTADALVPAPVAGGLRFTFLTAKGSHTCGRVVSGEHYCWGYNVDGQLGDATRAHRSRPVRVNVR